MTTRSQPLLIALIILLGVLAAGLAVGSGYLYLASATLQRQTTEQREALTETQRIARQLAIAHTASHTLTTRVPRHTAPWTWSEQLPVSMTQVAGLVEGSGGVIDTMQPAPVVASAQLTRFPLRLTLHATLKQLTALLRTAQAATPTLAVDGLTIHAGQPGDNVLSVELTLSSYALVEGAQPGGGRR